MTSGPPDLRPNQSSLYISSVLCPLPFLDNQGNSIAQEDVLGNGNTAVVLLQNGVAVSPPDISLELGL